MEGKAFLVVCTGCFHGAPVLVANAVVDVFEGDLGEEFLQWVDFRAGNGLIAGKEDAGVCISGDEGMCRIAVCADDGCSYRTIFI